MSEEVSTTQRKNGKLKPSEKANVIANVVELGKAHQKLEDVDEDPEEEEVEKHKRSLQTILVQSVAVASVVANVFAAVISLSYVSFAAAGVAVLVAPYVIYLQSQLQDPSTMRNVQNGLRRNVNNLQTENNKLQANVDVLEGEVAALKVQEKKLDSICQEQGTNVHELVGLVKENGEILRRSKAVVKNETIQMLTTMVIDSDGDCSGDICDGELQKLILRCHALPGVTVNEERLRKALDKGNRRTSSMLEMVKSISDESVPEQERVFFFEHPEHEDKQEEKKEEV